ncbi:nucleotide sugar dehydrogenase [Paenibacillus sp.]|jgi:UDP-N-acetyl-D-mannosaminuronic acid dehydrogenase|uniref:nucleotide sugar dehydrogenase n=1 Tax=Paenibacillus sp. TaxID=58172 RepID=UPI00281F8DDB|nr:nucleotide sugar dehydrogenase [Paenibacillus sp.]MDR0267488.1 nucleotide sugar dehydrogenase [Paenibacillus sp.]
MNINNQKEICMIGLGYVGITLAGAFLRKGARVSGVEIRESVCESLKRGQIHLQEPGLEEIVRETVGKTFNVSTQMPEKLSTAIICVSTPFGHLTKEPNLEQLVSAAQEVANRMTEDTLVIVRSTVPIGTTRKVVLPILQKTVANPIIVFAPERTIQGKAVEELLTLPQVIGTDDDSHFERAKEIFDILGVEIIRTSSWEAGEMIKLICNAHTDLNYGFGNEVAAVADCFGLDAHEVIGAANYHYPRPDLSRPGYVGGSCLTKDPYHLIHSAEKHGYTPRLIASARELNESLPDRILTQIEAILEKLQRTWPNVSVLLSGFAYKGVPQTDDLRGSPVWDMSKLLRLRGVKKISGHDFVVGEQAIAEVGAEPAEPEEAFLQADVIILLNNHPNYRGLRLSELIPNMKENAILFDLWGVLREQMEKLSADKIYYLGVGFRG